MIKVKPHSCVEQLIVSNLIPCGASNHTKAALSCDMRPHKETHSDTISCSTHSCGFPFVSRFSIAQAYDCETSRTRYIAYTHVSWFYSNLI